MNQLHVGPERKCRSCNSRFSWTGQQWLIVDIHGRLSYGGKKREKPEPEPQIKRCPQCHVLLLPGEVRIEEEA